MKELNPQNYDYLWTDYDVNFIFTSCYLFKEFRKADIVLIYDHLDKGLRFYLSKKCRKDLSGQGIDFYKNKFKGWRKRTLKDIKRGKNIIEQTKIERRAIRNMKNQEIMERILERVNLFQSLGGNYFYTEFFFLDKVEIMIKKYPQKYKKVIRNLEHMGRIKFEARNVLNSFYNYNKIFKPYISEISRRTGRNDLPWLSYEEIIRILNGERIKLSVRDRKNWILTKKNNWKMIDGISATKLLKKFDRFFFNKNAKFIKGDIANRGVWKGVAKVIRTIFSDSVNEEIKKIEKGDILVAATTGPEIMMACKKAGAIITDEGGITSHAAIVARELDIPCIIGTKIATKVLKDGDRVEVDANKGVVRIIK